MGSRGPILPDPRPSASRLFLSPPIGPGFAGTPRPDFQDFAVALGMIPAISHKPDAAACPLHPADPARRCRETSRLAVISLPTKCL